MHFMIDANRWQFRRTVFCITPVHTKLLSYYWWAFFLPLCKFKKACFNIGVSFLQQFGQITTDHKTQLTRWSANGREHTSQITFTTVVVSSLITHLQLHRFAHKKKELLFLQHIKKKETIRPLQDGNRKLPAILKSVSVKEDLKLG